MRSILLLGALLSGCQPAPERGGPGSVPDMAQLPPGRPLRTEVSSERWQYPYGTGVKLSSRHYRIYASVENATLLTNLPGFLEAAYANYVELTGLPPRNKGERLDVYMLASRQQWAELTRWVLGPDTAALSVGAGGYSYKGVGVYWDLRRRATLSVAAHEGLHQFLHHNLRHRLPLCIEEGLAVNAEGFHIRGERVVFLPSHNPARYVALRTAIIQERFLPMERLMSMNGAEVVSGTAERALGWYSQVWALIQFLRSDERYRVGLERMIADAAAGRFHGALQVSAAEYGRMRRRGATYHKRVSRPLFAHYITGDLEAFDREFLSFAWKLAKLSDPPAP